MAPTLIGSAAFASGVAQRIATNVAASKRMNNLDFITSPPQGFLFFDSALFVFL
jgi:hypothetical protein